MQNPTSLEPLSLFTSAAVALILATVALQWMRLALILCVALIIYVGEMSIDNLRHKPYHKRPKAAAAAAAAVASAASSAVREFLQWDKKAMSAQFMVLVVSLDGTEVVVGACGAMRVRQVKEKVAKMSGVDVHRQVLIGEEGELHDDEARLCACSLIFDSEAVVMLQLIVTEEGDRFSKSKIAKKYHSLIKGEDHDGVEGHSYMRPLRGGVVCSGQVHEWLLKVEGSNQLFVGIVEDCVEQDTRWYQNKGCWGIELRRKQMWLGGTRHQRTAGPVKFDVPCEVSVKLDCDAGTLSVGVQKQMEPVVICDSIPIKQVGMAVATYGSRCKVHILSYKSSL